MRSCCLVTGRSRETASKSIVCSNKTIFFDYGGGIPPSSNLKTVWEVNIFLFFTSRFLFHLFHFLSHLSPHPATGRSLLSSSSFSAQKINLNMAPFILNSSFWTSPGEIWSSHSISPPPYPHWVLLSNYFYHSFVSFFPPATILASPVLFTSLSLCLSPFP